MAGQTDEALGQWSAGQHSCHTAGETRNTATSRDFLPLSLHLSAQGEEEGEREGIAPFLPSFPTYLKLKPKSCEPLLPCSVCVGLRILFITAE